MGDISQNIAFIYDITEQHFIYQNAHATEVLQQANFEKFSEKTIIQNVLIDDQLYLKGKYNELFEKQSLTGVEFTWNTGTLSRTLSCDAYFLAGYHCIFCIIKDITKLKEYENYLIEYSTRKNALLEMIPHSLALPLHVMKNLTTNFSDGSNFKKTENIEEFLNLIQDSTVHCIDIIDDLLQQEHIESSDVYVKKTRFNVLEKIQFVHRQLKDAYPDRNFIFSAGPESLQIEGDEIKFLQVINILLANAINFTTIGGTIALKMQRGTKDFVIRISDDGIGIPETLYAFIFDYKTKAGRQGIDGQKSHGIGLSISKKLIAAMGGKIWFESEEGKGTTFYLSLPIQ
ncbi:MAG TPA: HAMP domain-containing sensor histidine kinase [Chryseolinea sp.]|nr:HAMP domain-containing sensor histidine kinase [Chryseolinea sp.]